MKTIAFLRIISLIFGFAVPASGQLTSIAALQACINNSSSTTCTLAAGTYTVSGSTPPVSVNWTGSNSLTINGGGAYIYSDGTTTGGIINIQNTTSPVLIENFQLYNPTADCSTTYPGPSGVPPLMSISGASIYNTSSWPSDPFTYSGPWAVEVYNNTFNCGQGTGAAEGIQVSGVGSSTFSNEIYIHGNYFYWSTVGFFGNATIAQQTSPAGCDSSTYSPVAFRDSTAVNNPRNIKISGNYWYHTGQGALQLAAARWVTVSNNTFTDDAYVYNSGSTSGGVILLTNVQTLSTLMAIQ